MWKIITGNNVDVLRTYEDNTFDSVVTDPPYGIAFLGKDWDSKKATETTSNLVALQNLPSTMKHTSLADDLEFQYWMRDVFSECLRVLKPGGYLLAFSAARTYHHMAMAAQTAGFEIRDQLMWLYGSGFPKAQDIGKGLDKRAGKQDPNYGTNKHSGIVTEGQGRKDYRCSVCNKTVGTWVKDCKEPDCGQKYTAQTELGQQWTGWKTALKPAHEPIVMARKPFSGSTIDNVLEHGTGALNIDASRIAYAENDDERIGKGYEHQASAQVMPGESKKGLGHQQSLYPSSEGRFPSNVIMDAEAGAILDAQAPKTGNGHRAKTKVTGYGKFGGGSSSYAGAGEKVDGLSGASKFFYCPKVSRAERHAGFENLPKRLCGPGGDGWVQAQEHQGNNKKGYTQDGTLGRMKDKMHQPQTGNNHPTVKPVELMKYLVRLVTPANGRVLDPFNGSGSTGMACVELGYDYVGVELDENYVEIAEKRIKAWEEKHKGFVDLFEENA